MKTWRAVLGTFIIGLVGAGFAVFAWRRLAVGQRIAVVCLAGSWLMFVLLVRWQPYNSRLHLPLVVLTAPMIAFLLKRLPAPLSGAALVIFALGAVPALLSNQTRPLIGLTRSAPTGDRPRSILSQSRASAYFNARPDLAPVYRRLVREVGNSACRTIGVVAGYDSWEYPLWALSRPPGVRFTHLEPATSPAAPSPCLVIGLDQNGGWRGPVGYLASWRDGGYSIWTAAAGQ